MVCCDQGQKNGFSLRDYTVTGSHVFQPIAAGFCSNSLLVASSLLWFAGDSYLEEMILCFGLGGDVCWPASGLCLLRVYVQACYVDWLLMFCVSPWQTDYYFEYTECDSTGSRWRVAIPQHPGACAGLPAPVRGTECSELSVRVENDSSWCVYVTFLSVAGTFTTTTWLCLFGCRPTIEWSYRPITLEQKRCYIISFCTCYETRHIIDGTCWWRLVVV